MDYAKRVIHNCSSMPSAWKGSNAMTINSVGVIGGGTMGQGIVIALLSAGYNVFLVEKDKQATIDANKRITRLLTTFRKTALLDNLTTFHNMTNLQECDLVIEAAYEDMELKKSIYSQLDKLCKSGAILATNTSTLSIDKMAQMTTRPTSVIGIHFFVPADRCPMIEIVLGQATAPVTIATAIDITKRMEKVPVIVKNCPAFVANRTLGPYLAEALRLVEDYGIMPHEIDQAITNFGFPTGPFQMIDLISLDTFVRVNQSLSVTSMHAVHCLIAAGRLGKKMNKGFYKYVQAGNRRRREVDGEVDQILSKVVKFKHSLTEREIVERCMFPMINEGFRIIEEGIVQKPEHVDVIWLLGFGWPMDKSGGPLRWAILQGPSYVASYLDKMASECSNVHSDLIPSQILMSLSRQDTQWSEEKVDRWLGKELWNQPPRSKI